MFAEVYDPAVAGDYKNKRIVYEQLPENEKALYDNFINTMLALLFPPATHQATIIIDHTPLPSGKNISFELYLQGNPSLEEDVNTDYTFLEFGQRQTLDDFSNAIYNLYFA